MSSRAEMKTMARPLQKNLPFLGTVLVIALFSDLSLNFISDVVNIVNNWGIGSFLVISIVSLLAEICILRIIKENRKKTKDNSRFKNLFNHLVTAIQYGLTALIGLLVLQVIFTSMYFTFLINVIFTVSFGLGAVLMTVLSLKFFRWYAARRNFLVLAYALGSAANSISNVILITIYNYLLLQLPFTRTPASEKGFSVDIEPHTFPDYLVSALSIVNVVYFIIFWLSIALLLRDFSKNLGIVKYWLILSLPLVSFASIFLVADPLLEQYQGIDLWYVRILGYALPNLVTGLLLFMPFWIISKNITIGSPVRKYLFLAALGFLLSNIVSAVSIDNAPYPPLGIINISSAAFAYYLIYIGISYSVVSLTEDTQLRYVMLKSAKREVSLLGDISFSASQDELTKLTSKVFDQVKKNQEEMVEQTGVYPSLSEGELKTYIEQVLEQIKNKDTKK